MSAEVIQFPPRPRGQHWAWPGEQTAVVLFLPLTFMWWVPLIWLEYWRKALR